MIASPPKRRIALKSPGEGAFRIKLVGEDPTDVVQALLTGAEDTRSLTVRPGSYMAFVENVASSQKRVGRIVVGASGRKTFDLQDLWVAPMFPPAASRPNQALSVETEKADSPDRRSQRRFSIGISVDNEPDRPGGWAGELPGVSIHFDETTQRVVIDLARTADWLKRPRWRLTVAVENAPAWRLPLAMFRDGLRLTLQPTISEGAEPDVTVSVAPRNAMVASLVASLQRANEAESTRILGWSTGGDPLSVLADKRDDPWAAAAAAILLTRHRRVGAEADWILRLPRLFPWLPDAHIAAAWAEVALTDDAIDIVERRCLHRLQEARNSGSPYFSASNSLALQLLSGLMSGSESSTLRTAARSESKAWSRHSRRAMRTGAFLSWERPAVNLMSGTLPNKTYAVIVRGCVGARSFSQIATADDVRTTGSKSEQ